MALDASIYSQVQPAQQVSPLDAMSKAMSLSNLGLQNQNAQLANQQAQYNYDSQQQAKQAYQDSVNPDGSLDQQKYISKLGSINPSMAFQAQQRIQEMTKAKAEANIAQVNALHQQATVAVPFYKTLTGMSDEQAAQAYPTMIHQMAQQGVDIGSLPPTWNREVISGALQRASQYKEQVENQLTTAKTAEAQSNTAMAPAKLNADLYGSRSPNAELSSQYDKQAAPIRSSQLAMQQMIDNYKNPTPQGDASLILNAFKIKFPTAPDVNSLEELSKSQAVPDKWRNAAHAALAGGLDQNTRDNLMRDGISTFRANVGSLRGIQQRYQDRAKQQNVNDPTLTAEPAIEDSYQRAMDLQKQIGPYVPPSERDGGGIVSGITKLASSVFGTKSANAAPAIPPAPKGMIWMKSPSGKIKAIPESAKGEAIAAGGSVVSQ